MFKLRFLAAALVLSAVLSPAAHAASVSKVFTLQNSGNGALTITTAAQPISGNTAEYALTGNTCTAVAPGNSCALTVRFTPTGTGTRPAAALNFTTNGTNGPAHSIALAGTGAPNEVARTIAANASNVNMAALFSNPTAPATYVLTINSGVYVTATSTATAALTTGTFPAGSTVKIINNGYIVGKGGQGGQGAADNNIMSCAAASTAFNGSPGGPAITLNTAVILSNTSGNIYAGGGGGGGGGEGKNVYPGGGGGGGQGSNSSAGGAGGYEAAKGTAGSGTTGTLSSAGVGGAGITANAYYYSGNGGAGGGFGLPGAAGGYNQNGAFYDCGNKGAGGAAGKAVITNGKAITWQGGNNTTQVRGLVQ